MAGRAVRRWPMLIRDRRGMAGIEFAMICPVLVLLLFGSLTLFVAIRDNQNSEKATFTIGDMISRETAVTDASLSRMRETFARMASDGAASIVFRVSSVRKSGLSPQDYVVDWSYAPAPATPMATPAIPVAILPALAQGDTVILTETTLSCEPVVASISFCPGGGHRNTAVNRPRYIVSIPKS